ncbi:MAG: acyl-CoA thioester hydrolase [Spirosomataceae bacterium]|jgi:acyl-CoA thioester hydrolase
MFKLKADTVYQKVTQSRSLIRFQDCDPLNHLNNAKYFDYYFNAREDNVAAQFDFKFSEIFQQYHSIWVVYQHQIAYLRPAHVNEWVQIHSRIIHYNADTLLTEYYMTDDEGGEVKNVLVTTSKYIDTRVGRRTTHQPFVMDYLEATAFDNISMETYDFQDRLKVIKKEMLEKKATL